MMRLPPPNKHQATNTAKTAPITQGVVSGL